MKRALYEVSVDKTFFEDDRLSESYFVGRARTKREAIQMAYNFIVITMEESGNRDDYTIGPHWSGEPLVGLTDSYDTTIELV